MGLWGGGGGAFPVPLLVAGSARHRPIPAQQEGAPLSPALGFVAPPGSEQDVSLLEETIRNSS